MDRISQIQNRIRDIESQFNPQPKQEGPSFQAMLSQAQNTMRVNSTGGPQSVYGQMSPVTAGSSGFVNPCPAGKLSPYKGDDGLDIHAPVGTPVYAAKDGVVVYNDPSGHSAWEGPGNDTGAIRIRHADGTETWYAHLSDRDTNLKPGMTVKAGQEIAKVGTANNVPHLHMSVFYSSGGDAGGFMDPFELAKAVEQGGLTNVAQNQGAAPMPPYNPVFGMNNMLPGGVGQSSPFNQVGSGLNMNSIMNMNLNNAFGAMDSEETDKS